MSEVMVDALCGRQETSPRALQHLSMTYRSIVGNLQSQAIPSNGTTSAVVSMAIHEDLRGHPERSKVHMEALARIVELWGGVDQFQFNKLLLLKLCR